MKAFITIFLGSISFVSKSQDIVQWKFRAVKIVDKTYEIHLTPSMQSPSHIYSQTSPEGGASPTKISFNKNPLASNEGPVKEFGKIVSKYEDVFEVAVRYFEGKADFVQVVKLKANVKTNLNGKVELVYGL